MTDIAEIFAEIAAEIAAQKLLRYPFSTISTANGEALLAALAASQARVGELTDALNEDALVMADAARRVAELETKVEGFLSASIHIEIVARWKAAEARIAELEIVGRRFYDAVLAVSEPALRNENEPPKETLDRLTDTAREFKAILTPGTPGEAE